MNEKRKAFIQELKEMGLSEDQFLNQLLFKNPSSAEIQGMFYLELYYKANEREQKIIKSRLINLALREKKDWAWNPLIKLVERELGDPILRDKFILPVLRGEIQHPKYRGKSDGGRPKTDEFRDEQVFYVLDLLHGYCGFTPREARRKVAEKLGLKLNTVERIQREFRSTKATP